MIWLAMLLIAATMAAHVDAHGRLVEPPSRSSMWRYGFNTPINYNDNQLSCGGFGNQWSNNNGRCGICGDPWNGPRPNEAGGIYATGTLGRTYSEGETITASLDITKNHGGWFEFRICPNNNPSKRATEVCLNRNLLAQPSGSTRYQLPTGEGMHSVQLVLPVGVTCTQCVFQWKWNTASNWGCDGGSCCKGCGPQEHFYGCADIAITMATQPVSGSGSGPSASGQPIQGPLSSIFQPILSSNTNTQLGQSSMVVGSGSQVNSTSFPTVSNCRATDEWKAKYSYADAWCQTQCATGNCPSQYCADSCRTTSGSSTITASVAKQQGATICSATPEWKVKYAYADEWCRVQCGLGNCPQQYCNDSCRMRLR